MENGLNLHFDVRPCEASDGTSSSLSSRAIACSDEHSGPHLDPALPGVQKVAAKNLAVGFLDLRLRLAMSVGTAWLEIASLITFAKPSYEEASFSSLINCFMHEHGPEYRLTRRGFELSVGTRCIES